MMKRFRNLTACVALAVMVATPGCAPTPPRPAAGHLEPVEQTDSDIPAPVTGLPVLPPPKPAAPEPTYSVVVTDVPVDELLFAVARDARINIDVHPGLEGRVTLNALDQTLPQILERISAQVDIRYRFDGDLLIVEPDHPYLQNYQIDYVNLARSSSSSNSIATRIATTGQSALSQNNGSSGSSGSSSGNNSITEVTSTSENSFWETLRSNILSMLDIGEEEGRANTAVILNRETGMITIRANQRQHRQIRRYIDRLMASAHRQVLIEATVVEVQLKNDYRFGVDWSRLADNGTGLSFSQNLLGKNLLDPPNFVIGYAKNSSVFGDITATVKMLQEFGNVKVLSSPKIMAINNQTALLKVVDNIVYFTIEANTTVSQTLAQTTFTTTPHTVPVGFVMAVTPQISADQGVALNVRPTISRVTGFVSDPNPTLAQNNIESLVPQIQVREMESVLRVRSGQIAVLGGLIQDSVDLSDSGLPGLSGIKGVGDAFTYRNNKLKKSELVVFLRPRVMTNLDEPLNVYADYLPKADEPLAPARASAREAWH